MIAMKKLFSFLLISMMMNITAMAQEIVPLVVYNVDDKPISHGTPKTPMRPPVVYIEDNTLTFAADHPEYVLFIREEEGDVVYTTVVSPSVTQVVLPTTLSGEYQIELTMGSWLFTGWINL